MSHFIAVEKGLFAKRNLESVLEHILNVFKASELFEASGFSPREIGNLLEKARPTGGLSCRHGRKVRQTRRAFSKNFLSFKGESTFSNSY